MDVEFNNLNPRIITSISPVEKTVLECHEQGMKLKDIAKLLGLSYPRTRARLSSAEKKQEFLETIHGTGEKWIGEMPGIPSHCVGALQRKGVFTVSELLQIPEYRILQLYEVGPKSIDAIRRYKVKELG